MALSDNLIAYWAMDEASGDAIDSVGSLDLTDTNTVGAGTGKVSGARDFEASNNEYFTRTSSSELQTGDIDFTVQAWVNGESFGTNFVIGKWQSGGYEYVLYYAANFWRWRVESFNQVLLSHTPSTGTWYLLHVWHDSVNNQLGIALDAGTPSTTSYSGGITATSTALYIGVSGDGGSNWDGLIDEVGFWKRVLTSDERTELYNSGSGRDYAYITGAASGQPTIKRMGGVTFAANPWRHVQGGRAW